MIKASTDLPGTLKEQLAAGFEKMHQNQSEANKVMAQPIHDLPSTLKEQLAAGIGKMQEELSKASKDMAQPFDALPASLTEQLATGIKGMHEQMSRANNAMVQPFADLPANLIEQLATGITKMQNQLEPLPATLNATLSKRLDGVDAACQKLNNAAENLGVQLTNALSPSMLTIQKQLKDRTATAAAVKKETVGLGSEISGKVVEDGLTSLIKQLPTFLTSLSDALKPSLTTAVQLDAQRLQFIAERIKIPEMQIECDFNHLASNLKPTIDMILDVIITRQLPVAMRTLQGTVAQVVGKADTLKQDELKKSLNDLSKALLQFAHVTPHMKEFVTKLPKLHEAIANWAEDRADIVQAVKDVQSAVITTKDSTNLLSSSVSHVNAAVTNLNNWVL